MTDLVERLLAAVRPDTEEDREHVLRVAGEVARSRDAKTTTEGERDGRPRPHR